MTAAPQPGSLAATAAALTAADPVTIQAVSRDQLAAVEIDLRKTRDLRPEVIGADGRIRVLPAAFWAGKTQAERALLGHLTGTYSIPTTELVDHLRERIAGRRAIEIAAGNGVLAQALGITATDSYQQTKEPYRSHYEATGQPTVPYGPNVSEAHASRAVRLHKPQIVIGCWVTHKYDPARHGAGGNEVGVDEADILRNCETYIMIGNEKTHAGTPLWARPHTIEYPDWLYSRAMNGGRDFIATWAGARRG